MSVPGRRTRGGHVYGTVPALDPDNLEDGRFLPVSTDSRSVLAAVSGCHLGVLNHAELFPGWKDDPLKIFRA